MGLVNLENYGCYADLVRNGSITIYTKFITKDNLDYHFDSLINILNDGIELPEVHHMMVHIVFADEEEIDLSLFDYLFNLIFWELSCGIGKPIDSTDLFFYESNKQKYIKEYIDQVFIKPYRTILPFKTMNNIIDNVFGKFRRLTNFQMYLANTVCLEDTIELMNKYEEFNDIVHLDLTDVPIEDVKDKGMEATNRMIDYIMNSDHCLRDSFASGEAVSPKQFKEVSVSIGSKPDGQGGVYPSIINTSFINGGLNTPEAACIDSSVGRIAQILQKSNVGTSGAFARILGLNNIDTTLHEDPNYSCDTKNFEEVTIKSSTILKMYDMRYYRMIPNGIERRLDSDRDKHLIGKTLYFRSPMTCASYSRGRGICYRCYGDLAYVNKDINIGKMAAELLSSIYTQILLSAKHLLESLVVKLNWNKEFNELFVVNFNTIQLKEDKDYNGYKLVIDSKIDQEEELDNDYSDYNEYVSSFTIATPEGTMIRMHTSESDNIYIHPDLYEKVNQLCGGDIEAIDEDDSATYVEIDMNQLKDLPILFVMALKNNELSKTMMDAKNIINKGSVTKKFNRNSILEAFIDTNINGHVILNAVHFEVLLCNQIRAVDDILEKPQWEYPNEPCELLTLNEALTNNQSITIRLEYSKISKTLYTPASFKITKPSSVDLFFMEKPQEFIHNDDCISEEDNLLINDIENNKVNPLIFMDEKVIKK